MDRWVEKQINGWIEKGWMGGWIDGLEDKQTDGWREGLMEGWMGKCIDRQMGG